MSQSPNRFDVSSVNGARRLGNVIIDVIISPRSFVFGQSLAKVSAGFTDVSSLAVAAYDLVSCTGAPGGPCILLPVCLIKCCDCQATLNSLLKLLCICTNLMSVELVNTRYTFHYCQEITVTCVLLLIR